LGRPLHLRRIALIVIMLGAVGLGAYYLVAFSQEDLDRFKEAYRVADARSPCSSTAARELV